MQLFRQIINGIDIGSIYALIALGYTMVYGIAKMLNFAHGDVIMVGAFTLVVGVSTLGLPLWAAILLCVAVCTVLGIMIERVAYKPLRSAPPLSVLITAIGVSYLLQSAALLIFGSEYRRVPTVISLPSASVGGFELTGLTLVTLAVSLAVMILLILFMKHTMTGKAMLAVSEDKTAATLMGINANRIITLTFAIGSALAAIAGVLYSQTYGFVGAYSGSMPGIKAFVAAVLGGIGSIPGAMLGGVLLGIAESLAKAYISTELADAVVFGILILVLLVRPQGFLGKKLTEKV